MDYDREARQFFTSKLNKLSTLKTQAKLSNRQRYRGIFLILAFGIAIFLWQLGSTGLVDETPPLFAAASRAMSLTGDWFTPRVN